MEELLLLELSPLICAKWLGFGASSFSDLTSMVLVSSLASTVTESSYSISLFLSLPSCARSLANWGSFRRLLRFELKRFLMALSVRPSTYLAMSHQRLPCTKCSFTISMSSSMVHLRFVIFGSKWLCHLSRHCFPIRPGRLLATWVQFLAPCETTILVKISSSSLVQVPFAKWLQLLSSSQRVWHLISDLPQRSLLMRFQEF